MSSPAAVPVDSKSGKKRKTKTEAPVSTSVATPSTEAAVDAHTNGAETQQESPYIKELTKYAPLT